MAEVIPASGEDWREIERRASLPEGDVERALLEILQRLVPVENRVVPVAAPPAGGVTVEEESACVPSGAIAGDWLSYHPRMAAPAPAPVGGKLPTALEVSKELDATYREDECRYDLVAFAHTILAKWGNCPAPTPTGGVTVEELAWILDDIHSGWGCADQAHWMLQHPRIGPLLRGEGQAPGAAPVRVVLPKDPPPHLLPSPDDDGWGYVVRATWAAARAEVERQQGGQAPGPTNDDPLDHADELADAMESDADSPELEGLEEITGDELTSAADIIRRYVVFKEMTGGNSNG